MPTAGDLARASTLRLTAAEVREAAGLDATTFAELTTFGLLRPDPAGHYGEPALAVARAAGALAAYGVEPRHLRAFRTAADREIGLVAAGDQPDARARHRRTGRRGGGPHAAAARPVHRPARIAGPGGPRPRAEPSTVEG